MREIAKASLLVDKNGCKDCQDCEDLDTCLISLRRSVGYLAEINARMIESNSFTNNLIKNWVKDATKKIKSSSEISNIYS